MRKLLLIIAIIALGFHQMNAGVIVLEGNYQGQNLYVQNPFASSGVGFCTMEVKVNEEITTDEWNSSAFEIDFMSRQLNIGDPVIVKIKYKEDCTPRVLNAHVIKPRSTCNYESIAVDRDGVLKFSTTGESGSLPFIIEQYKWNKWVKVGEVEGAGGADQSNYEFKVNPHFGPNKVRVKQVDHIGPHYSEAARFRSVSPEVVFSPQRVEDEIIFTNLDTEPVETSYEIYDQNGNLKRKGYGSKVNVSNLKQGAYYLNFGSKTETFLKR